MQKINEFSFVYCLSIVKIWHLQPLQSTFTKKNNRRSMKTHLQIIVTGKLENTGFRFFALRIASLLNINGEIKQDGDKIIIDAEGEDFNIKDFTVWCHKGPDSCEVDTVTCKEKDLVGYDDFRIL
jgi:acylphosphatase